MRKSSPFSRNLVAAVAAVMMGSITVAAAVGPAQASVAPVQHAIERNAHA